MKQKYSLDRKILVGISNINSRGGASEQLNIELCALLTRMFKANELDIDIKYYTSTASITKAASNFDGLIILFSNFPPDSAYEDSTVIQAREIGDGDHITSIPADSYETTKRFFNELLSKNKNIELHVITGAPFEKLTNFEITSLSEEASISVQRKMEWLYSRDYPQKYADYVVNTLKNSLYKVAGSQSYDRSQIYSSQFSRLTVLTLCDQTDDFANTVVDMFRKSCGQMSFNFSIVRTIEQLHNILTETDVDSLLILDVPGKWFKFIESLAFSNKQMAIFYLTSFKHEIELLPTNVTSHYLKPHVSKDFRILLDSYLEAIENLRLLPPNIDPKKYVLKMYFDCINEGSSNSFSRANRYLIRIQHLLLDALQRQSKFFLFCPFDSISDFQTFSPLLPFISPYSIATYTNPLDLESQFKESDGFKVSKGSFSIQTLWDLPRRRYGFLSPDSLTSFLKHYAILFKAGNVQFFPSPTMTQVLPNNVDEINPQAKQFVRQIHKKPYWMMNKDPNDYFPAAAIGAQFACSQDAISQTVDRDILEKLEIPYITSAKPQELAKLLLDESESINSFREHASEVIEDCNSSIEHESATKILKRFSKEMNNGVAKLDDRIRSLKRTNRVALVAGTVLTASVTISSALGLEVPKTILAAAGSGGGVGVLTHLLNYKNELKNFKQEKFHFLWRLSRK